MEDGSQKYFNEKSIKVHGIKKKVIVKNDKGLRLKNRNNVQT